jgi:hypothetical protein
VLPLIPVAVLVLFVLGALALDSAALFLGQRRLADLAAAVATDAVASLDREGFYASGGEPDDLGLALGAVEARRDQLVALAMRDADRTLDEVACDVALAGTRVTATCTATSRGILAPAALGGGAQRLTSTEVAEGRLRGGG